MAETRIISRDDVNEFFQISINIDNSRIDPHILRAQQADLKPILGDALYYDFIEDYDGTVFQTQKYIDLFQGVAYQDSNSNTIYFSGIRPLLSAFCYSRIVGNNKIHIVRGGNVVKTVEESEPMEDFNVRLYTREAVSEAIRLESELIKFLHENVSDYPLYDERISSDSDRRTSFNFERIDKYSYRNYPIIRRF